MRRFLTAVFAAVLFMLPWATPPATPATTPPLACTTDPAGDVFAVSSGGNTPNVTAPKTDLRRFCAGAGARVFLRWRVPGVDPTADGLWNSGDAYVLGAIDTTVGGQPEYILSLVGPFVSGHFEVSLSRRQLDGGFIPQECANMASGYDDVNKVIRASFPAVCIGNNSTFQASGQSYRDPSPADGSNYLTDPSSPVSVPPV